MSGGSFNYLAFADASDLFVSKRSDLEDMAETLARLGYAKDAAIETQRLLAEVRSFEVKCEVALARLTGVWRAVEWWHSCDSSEQAVHDALAEYRGEEA